MYDPDDRRHGKLRILNERLEVYTLPTPEDPNSTRIIYTRHEFVEPIRRVFYVCPLTEYVHRGDYHMVLDEYDEPRLAYCDEHAHGGFLGIYRRDPQPGTEVVHARLFPLEFLGVIKGKVEARHTRDPRYCGPTNTRYPQLGDLVLFSPRLLEETFTETTINYLRHVLKHGTHVSPTPIINHATLQEFIV